MLKKVSILGLGIMLLISMMSGCISTGYLNEGSSTIEEQTTTTPVTTTTTPVNKNAISAQLAQLTNEDGTGVISFGMSGDEIAQKMEQYNIPYEKTELDTIVTPDGSFYNGGGIGYFKMMQTKSGLKVGDSLSKVIELYGQPDKKSDEDNCYIYFTGSTTDSIPIALQVQMKGEVVDIIFIKLYEELG